MAMAALREHCSTANMDFAEFEAAMWVLTQGSTEERLRCVFDVYDADKSGTIKHEELLLYCYIANRMKNKTEQKTREELKQEVTNAFATIDADMSGTLSIDECLAALKDNEFLGSL